MTEKKIDKAAAIALLERVVAERGEDYAYDSDPATGTCKYVHNNNGVKEPGCAVGLAASYIGISIGTLQIWDMGYGDGDSDFDTVAPRDMFTPGAIKALAAFQRSQDIHFTYASALEKAKAV